MDRDDLVGLLGGEREAFVACRQALLTGARIWVTELGQPATELVAI